MAPEDKPLEATVRVIYTPDAVAEIRHCESTDVVKRLREHLVVLGIPQPRADRVVIIPGGVQFSWPKTNIGAVLHKNLCAKIPCSPDTLESLSIASVTLEQRPIDDEHISLSTNDQPPPPKRFKYNHSEMAPDLLSSNSSIPPKPTFDAFPSTSSELLKWGLPLRIFPANPDVVISDRRGCQKKPEPLTSQATEFLRAMKGNSEIDSGGTAVPSTTRHPSGTSHRVLQELSYIRMAMHEGFKRERSIVAALKKIGVEAPSQEWEITNDFLLAERIEQAKIDLEEGRKKTAELEDVLSDIQRKCPEPFVVPALLDAFIMVSRAAGELIDKGDTMRFRSDIDMYNDTRVGDAS